MTACAANRPASRWAWCISGRRPGDRDGKAALPAGPGPPGVARLHPTDRTGGLRPRARPGRGDPEPAGHRGPGAARGLCGAAARRTRRRAGTAPARLRDVRAPGARLASLAQGLCRYGRVPDPGGAGGRPAGVRRIAAPRLRREGARPGGGHAAVAAAGSGGADRHGPRPGGEAEARRPRSVVPRSYGAAAARDTGSGGPALQRSDRPAPVRTARRELGVDGLPRERHAADRGPAPLRGAPAAAQRTAAAGAAEEGAPRGAPGGEPEVPERRQRTARRAGAARSLRAPAGVPVGGRQVARRVAGARAGAGPGQRLPRPAHGHAARGVPPLRRGARDAVGPPHIRQALLHRRALRTTPRGRRPVPGHDGRPLRRLGAAPGPLPHGARRGQIRPDAASGTARTALRPLPLPVPGGVARQRRAAEDGPDRSAAGARRDDLAGAGEAAGPRRRADLVPGARRGADRVRVRDHDGVPAGDRDGSVGGDQGAEAGRGRRRRSTWSGSRRWRPGRGRSGCGTARTAS